MATYTELVRSLHVFEVSAILKVLLDRYGVQPFPPSEVDFKDLSDSELADLSQRVRDLMRTLGGAR